MSCEIFEAASSRAQRIKGNNDFMGGMHVILFGDFHQCLPVMQTALWKQSTKSGRLLWQQNVTSCATLTQIMRQSDEQPWAELLRRLRTGICTDVDIATVANIGRRVVNIDDPARRMATILSYKRKICAVLSQRCAARDAASVGQPLIVWNATYTRNKKPVRASLTLMKEDGHGCGPHTFTYAHGMPIMLLSNQICGSHSVAML